MTAIIHDIEQNTILTRQILLSLFQLNMRDGKLFWKSPPKRHPALLGREAGTDAIGRNGEIRRVIRIDRRAYKRAHLIFFLSRGRWPRKQVDHKNRKPLDDRPANLREATHAENCRNHQPRRNRLLPTGVRALCGQFQSRITFDGRLIYLGVYPTPTLAHRAYCKKRKELFGVFS